MPRLWRKRGNVMKAKTFEAKLRRLEQIVRTIEQGDVTLDESMKLFQEGTELAASCEKLLDEAQLQVTKITAGTDGAPQEEEFQNDDRA